MEIYTPPLNLGRNRIINGNFATNQRAYASGGALGSGAFGHDRWRDSYGGTAYTFTQASQSPGNAHSIDTLVTITSGQLTHPVEITEGGTFVLSWQGSSVANLTGTVGITAPSTNLTSPAVVTLPPGVTVYVNFGPGTLGLVQLEAGTSPTPFERRTIGVELALCRRFFQKLGGAANGDIYIGGYVGNASSNYNYLIDTIGTAPMRAVPTATVVGGFYGLNVSGTPTLYPGLCTLGIAITAAGVGYTQYNSTGTSTYITLSAEI